MTKMAPFVMALAMMAIVKVVEAASVEVSALLKIGDQINCALDHDCDPTELTDASYRDYYKTDKSSWASLGLDPNLLHINEIAFGFVPAFLEKLHPTSRKISTTNCSSPWPFLTSWDKELKAIDWHIKTVQNLEGNPVWCIALMPSEGLDYMTYEVVNKIAAKLKHVNDLGITVWLRFAHEMNGGWYSWGMQPEKFKEKWQLLAKEVKRVTNRTYMLWSPNAMFGDSSDKVRGGYTPYFPEPWGVDIFGLSFYHWGKGAERINKKPEPDRGGTIELIQDYLLLLRSTDQTVGTNLSSLRKPPLASPPSGNYPVRWGSYYELDIKITWLHLLVDRYIKKTIPDLKAKIWFEVLKQEAAP
ncbi:hypothetical protein Pst134EA_011130 [Puccinia striiformis f. sp. tritici]|uniref:hypothetical protein n=1 Tax=Puccinia striiformis f. sp. tritici TaxID=168172 RepID=UPI00200752D8|nr:hypothetical protein Pst134EA_011130 [Puccinia striiformis f. sp. tritici]KAH9467487.1 hypothetical protein Pst134EA_011130 [Puccinia striiformis f. sp. tritici]